MRPVSKELGEICYPFIYEDSPVCDFEITADELCSRIGLVLSMELDHFSRDILTRMQPNIYHVNGSIRGKLAITEAEVDELKADYDPSRLVSTAVLRICASWWSPNFQSTTSMPLPSKEGGSCIGCG